MKYLIYLLFFLLSFGQLQRISFLDQQVNIYLHEVVMAAIGIRLIGRIGQIGRRGSIRWVRAIIFFLGVLLLSLINNFWLFTPLQNLVGFLYWGRLALYFAFFIILLNWVNKGDKGNKGILRKGLDVFIILTVIFSYLQYFLYPNLRNLYYLGWDPHQYRVFGLFFDTTITGIIFVMMFFWIMEKVQLSSPPRSPFGTSNVPATFDCGGHLGGVLTLASSSILGIGLVGLILFTYSRITYLSFIVGIVYYFLITPRRSPSQLRQGFAGRVGHLRGVSVLIFLFLFFIFIFLLPRPFGEGVKLERIFTIEARIADYKEGIRLWVKKPILGYGYNRLRYIKKTDNVSHSGAAFSSSFLTILVTSGVIGLIGLIGLIGRIFKQGNQLVRTIILVTTVASLFDNVLLNNFVLLLFFLIVSLSFISNPVE